MHPGDIMLMGFFVIMIIVIALPVAVEISRRNRRG